MKPETKMCDNYTCKIHYTYILPRDEDMLKYLQGTSEGLVNQPKAAHIEPKG